VKGEEEEWEETEVEEVKEEEAEERVVSWCSTGTISTRRSSAARRCVSALTAAGGGRLAATARCWRSLARICSTYAIISIT
jgi:hypothetical protein